MLFLSTCVCLQLCTTVYIIMHIVLKAKYDINILNLIPTVDVYTQRTIFGTVYLIEQSNVYQNFLKK